MALRSRLVSSVWAQNQRFYPSLKLTVRPWKSPSFVGKYLQNGGFASQLCQFTGVYIPETFGENKIMGLDQNGILQKSMTIAIVLLKQNWVIWPPFTIPSDTTKMATWKWMSWSEEVLPYEKMRWFSYLAMLLCQRVHPRNLTDRYQKWYGKCVYQIWRHFGSPSGWH